MQAQIITIGDELLIGQTTDTNSKFIASVLNAIGFEVSQITTISDKQEQIIEALTNAQDRVSLVITTGGLGPTKDDITKLAFCKYFDSKLITNSKVKAHILEFLSNKGIKARDRNIEQAEVPNNCEVIHNLVGTAPAMWFSKNKTVFIALPGIPYEMKNLMQTSIISKLKTHFKTPIIFHKTIMTKGLPESMLADKIAEWENNLPKNIKLAYLPSPEVIKLRLSVYEANNKDIEDIVNNEVEKLKKIIPEEIFACEEKYLEEIIGEILISKNKTLSTAESCTGGNIAKLITSVSGCSAYFEGSVVAYSNRIKAEILQVDTNNLEKYGAVSRQVVEEMAKGVLNLIQTDFSIATSGIAGPLGGSPEKPVGTVWIAVASKDKVISKKFNFGKIRTITVRRTSSVALNMLRLLIQT